MKENIFDEVTKALATSTTRRQALRRIGGILGGTALAGLFPGLALADNSDCAHFCNAVFAPGRSRPSATVMPPITQVCATPVGRPVRVAPSRFVVPRTRWQCTSYSSATCCSSGQTCMNGTCVATCPAGLVALSNGTCAQDCTASRSCSCLAFVVALMQAQAAPRTYFCTNSPGFPGCLYDRLGLSYGRVLRQCLLDRICQTALVC